MTNERDYHLQLLMEAATTGIAVLPVALITRRLIPHNFYLQIALAGATYHLLSEVVGANDWYIHHSAASLHNALMFSRRQKKVGIQQQKVCRLLVPQQLCSLVLWRGLPGKSTTNSIIVK